MVTSPDQSAEQSSSERAAGSGGIRQTMRTLAAVVTLQTNSGGTVTLETTVIRGSTGRAGFEILEDEGPQDTLRADGRGAASGGDAEQVSVASSSTGTRNQHGDPTIPLVSPEGSVSGLGNTFGPGGAGGAGAGRTPPPRRTYVRGTTGYSVVEARPPQQPIVVHEKAKAAVSMRVQRRDDQLYHEVASQVKGEAKRWFATVVESVSPEEEKINTLAVCSARSTGRSVGNYREGYGVELGAAISARDTRETTAGRGPLSTTSATAEAKEQSGLLGSGVTGYGLAWATTSKPPRRSGTMDVARAASAGHEQYGTRDKTRKADDQRRWKDRAATGKGCGDPVATPTFPRDKGDSRTRSDTRRRGRRVVQGTTCAFTAVASGTSSASAS
ncbi:hypothetical protein Pcac1_g23041 [Phytophthora cactorum]|nr:hypothetical protein Pcac1_g23041 [Phytophthora cactorum]